MGDREKLLKYKPTGLAVIGSFGVLIGSIVGMYIGLKRYRDRHTQKTNAFVYSIRCVSDKKKCDTEIRYTINDKLQKVMIQTPDPSPFTINQEITIYYDPNNITDIVVEPPSKDVALAIFVFSFILFLNIGWYMYNQYKIQSIINKIF